MKLQLTVDVTTGKLFSIGMLPAAAPKSSGSQDCAQVPWSQGPSCILSRSLDPISAMQLSRIRLVPPLIFCRTHLLECATVAGMEAINRPMPQLCKNLGKLQKQETRKCFLCFSVPDTKRENRELNGESQLSSLCRIMLSVSTATFLKNVHFE